MCQRVAQQPRCPGRAALHTPSVGVWFCCFEDSYIFLLVHSCKNFSIFHTGIYAFQGGWCTMANFARGNFAVADYDLLEDCPYVDDCVFAPEFMSNDYVRVTQLYCGGVGRQYKDYTHTEGNLEFDICTMWCSKPVSVLQDYCDAIKVHIFWPLLFHRKQSSIITRMHSCIRTSGFHACEISLKKLQQLELMEDIVDLAKKVVNDTFFIGGLLRIGYKIENKILAMEEALNWVKYTGDVTILSKLGAVDNCWHMLSIFFTEYKYHITKVVTENCSLLEEFKTQSCAECLEQGELMKMKGNEEFSKERYDVAIIYYSRAIECRPENHLLYGNRALCFLRTGQFRNALGDGKRATILKNNWTKCSYLKFEVGLCLVDRILVLLHNCEIYLPAFGGKAECNQMQSELGVIELSLKSLPRKCSDLSDWGHYRYCAALSMLGEYDWALQANIKAQKLCKNDPEGIKDLIQQHVKLQKQIEDLQGRTPTSHPVKTFCESGAYVPSLSAPALSTSRNFVETEKNFRKTNHEMANGGNQNPKVVDEALKVDDCDCHPEFVPPSSQPPKYKGKQKSRNNELEKFSPGSQETLPVDLKNILEKQFSKSSRAAHQDFANIMKMLRSLIQDGYTALLEQRCRSAAQAFTELLNGLDPQKIKQLNLAMINYVLVIYGRAISLLGIGQPEELSEAENQFKRMIEHYPSEGLDCLAYCGIGKVYLKKNRFLEALNHFEKARTLICRLPGVLTWPTSNVVIEETQPGKIKMLLEKFVEECRFPPVPDAICRYQKCHGYSKIQMYITDPDFKGFIRISCCQYCKIEFHMNCWKKLKTTTFNDKIDKDFLQGICLTPDCEGIISKIIIFSSGGQVKCKFEHKVIKEKVPPRPILKQKCSSLEKLRLKEDKKLKRKLQKKEAKKLAQERLEEDLRESNPPKTEEQRETINHVQSCQFLDDRILQCIKQYADKIKSGILNTSKLLKELLSWKVLTTEDYTTCFSSRNFLNEAVDYVIRHLIQEKNRVKTRVFLHVLSELKEVEPKLATWIQKLNSFGLDATGPFFSRYGAPLKELDFSIVTFLWNEKYGHKLGSIEGKQLDYFYEPTSLKEARCLIWLLEEHRDKFPALHNALDEFFDIMDSCCTVLRKQDSGDVPFNSAKIKNKGKKKKPKGSKPMLVGSGTPSVTPNNETVTSGEDHIKRSLNSAGPFVVPDHLRQDVEEFEALYEQRSNKYVVHNKKLWDINPKQKCSTLYDYFSHLLEERGPMEMSNKMFSEEYEFFPEETRQILEKAGGLKAFLLECPRFVVIDNCIALKKVVLRLKRKRKKKNIQTKVAEISKTGEYLRVKLPLNPTAREFKPDVKSKPVSDLPSAPPSEDVKPQPASANSPQSARDTGKPKPVSSNSSRSVSEDEKPKGMSSDYPRPVSEETGHKPVSSNSPKPVPEEVKATYWPRPHLVTGYCTYLPFRGFDITQTPPAFTSVLPTLPQNSIYTPLASVPTEYHLQRPIPVVPSFVASDKTEVHFEAHHFSAEDAPGNQIASETQILEESLETPVKSECSLDGADTAQSEAGGNDDYCGDSAKWEANPESTSEVTNIPCTQVVAVQVSWNITHQEVNTEPYGPFEAQQGGISQVEKEYQVLQDRLKEACENYEQSNVRGSEETKDLEEKLKRNVEENKISKTELDWFLEDLNKEIKKWEQEKKEVQERLKALKKKMKKVLNANEMYTQENDGKEKSLELLLDQSLEISNTFTNEKMKIEESIKKGKEHYEESLQRAVDAEVSVLENWKDMEVCKLQTMESQAEGFLKNLKLMSSDSAAYSDMDSDIHSWESFLSDIREEIEKAKSQFEERIQAIKNGSRLSELPKVQISELSFPACNAIHPKLLPESSGQDGRGPSTSTSHGTGDQTAAPEESSLGSAADSPVESPSCSQKAPQLPEREGTGQAAGPEPRPVADQKLPAAPERATRSSPSPKKPFNSVIKHLSVVFPCYSSTELAGFIKKVRNKNKTSLPGLSIDEIVQRVTEHILDEEKKKKVSCSNSCEICREVFKSKNMRELQCGHRFHKGCLKQWLKSQRTCPACLGHDLLSEE
uniref:RING-type E3 ubiquitin transferase n=1 Tax=Moschus moschiferus TaxID=68415 RepID=A0A8C6E0L2_MOSMO